MTVIKRVADESLETQAGVGSPIKSASARRPHASIGQLHIELGSPPRSLK